MNLVMIVMVVMVAVVVSGRSLTDTDHNNNNDNDKMASSTSNPAATTTNTIDTVRTLLKEWKESKPRRDTKTNTKHHTTTSGPPQEAVSTPSRPHQCEGDSRLC
ncbi:hypothetical protein Pmani_039996 [Petrolisthes manimaculis]|uniref:Secreted protein n=1 Tax=Petrolisthes manimaculis TaxID=1843537 RepID=A0AAE1NCL3_9EUCA|nr:hypothetical protein Pmani_039996 [Petrolisthes manimaculis]